MLTEQFQMDLVVTAQTTVPRICADTPLSLLVIFEHDGLASEAKTRARWAAEGARRKQNPSKLQIGKTDAQRIGEAA